MKTSLKGSYSEIAAQLNLEENDTLFIASDIRQLALQAKKNGEAFDADAFIASFQAALPKGTLIVPAYTDQLKNGDTFDHQKAKPTTGALSNKVFRRKDFIRTKDPLHSVFVWGVGAQELALLDGNSSLGEGSVFDWLYQKNAKMICIDVHFQNSLTFVHYIEEKRKVNYRKPYSWTIKRVFKEGEDQKQFIFHSRKPWVLTDLELLQNSSDANGVTKCYDFDGVELRFFELKAMHDHIDAMISRGEKLYRISLLHFMKTLAKKVLRRN